MKLEIALLLLAVTVCVKGGFLQGRSGYDCRRRCGYDRRYVCSTDGTTYDNECMMKCNWAYKSCDGRCPCYRSSAPVVYRPKPAVVYKPRPVVNYEPASVNYEPASVNYEPAAVDYPSVPDYEPIPVYNEPAPVYYDVPVQSDCVCSKDKDYVCTYDGETYDNECEANCDGKAKMCDGQCPCSK
ncbi:insoluble matrix shell protein 6 [Ruditapes philippinarum]|uniref:insoluble matrix shell protein 6 n=1 Tax=Ruditapes philippinarum TaxID=129788 RepID=UPI00295B1BE8|nr:insoluble matrix shell protein 6 [Ruditapes philippinarum]